MTTIIRTGGERAITHRRSARSGALGITLAASLLAAAGIASPAVAQDAGASLLDPPATEFGRRIETPISKSELVIALGQDGSAAPSEAEESTRIYGGGFAADGQLPYQVALVDWSLWEAAQRGEAHAQFCGGSIISADFVLTAAHCVYDRDRLKSPAEFIVETGAVVHGQGDAREIAEVIPHPDYAPTQNHEHDIALLRLAKPIRPDERNVAAVRIAPQGFELGETRAVASGWGLTREKRSSGSLRFADIDVVTNETCNAGFVSVSAGELADYLTILVARAGLNQEDAQRGYDRIVPTMKGPITENMVCAGAQSGAQSTCHGDSGGPLTIAGPGGQPLQVGVVSWGHKPAGIVVNEGNMPCGTPDTYNVFVRLGNYFDWIAGHVRGG